MMENFHQYVAQQQGTRSRKETSTFNWEQCSAFFGVESDYRAHRKAFEDQVASRNKLNVKLVKKWVGLPDEVNVPKIGVVLRRVKERLGDPAGVAACDEEYLKSLVREVWAEIPKGRSSEGR